MNKVAGTSSIHFAFVAEGNAETTDCWSGSALSLVSALRARGHRVDVVDVELSGVSRYLGALATWRSNREEWRQRFILGPTTFTLRSRAAAAKLKTQLLPGTQVLIQLGAAFDLGSVNRSIRHVLLADGNAAMASRAGDFSDISRLPPSVREDILRRERRVYDSVHRLWAMSAHLADSFVQDFGAPRSKIEVVYAGSNRPDLQLLPARSTAAEREMILFVGRQHHRKGLDLLLSAFRLIRDRFPKTELHIVGAPRDVTSDHGVISYGPLDPNSPSESALLSKLYREASVFCLPSRYEPFGIAFVEAMLSSLPCIGVNRWAMPEIIQHGETGLLVEPEDPAGIASALGQLFSDPDRALQMGRAGHKRAHQQFTWQNVAETIERDIQSAGASRNRHDQGGRVN